MHEYLSWYQADNQQKNVNWVEALKKMALYAPKPASEK